jgi:hypothetical protein
VADLDAALVQKILDVTSRKLGPDAKHNRPMDDGRARFERRTVLSSRDAGQAPRSSQAKLF